MLMVRVGFETSLGVVGLVVGGGGGGWVGVAKHTTSTDTDKKMKNNNIVGRVQQNELESSQFVRACLCLCLCLCIYSTLLYDNKKKYLEM